jgi:cell division protein FtsB
LTVVLGAILFSYLNPVVNFIHTYTGSSAERVQLHKLQAENTALHRKVKASASSSVLETAARSQGMIEPGERAYVIHGLHG